MKTKPVAFQKNQPNTLHIFSDNWRALFCFCCLFLLVGVFLFFGCVVILLGGVFSIEDLG